VGSIPTASTKEKKENSMIIKEKELREIIVKLDEIYDFLQETEEGNLDSFNLMTMATRYKNILKQAIALLENLEG